MTPQPSWLRFGATDAPVEATPAVNSAPLAALHRLRDGWLDGSGVVSLAAGP